MGTSGSVKFWQLGQSASSAIQPVCQYCYILLACLVTFHIAHAIPQGQ